MNVSIKQLEAIRPLINANNKKDIANYTGKSIRTIEAVLYGERANHEIEEQLFKIAKNNVKKLSNLIELVEAKNKNSCDKTAI